MTGIRTKDEEETFSLDLLSRSDDAIVRTFKVCSEFPDERAASLCLQEMARRNITCELTLSPRELRAAAKLARSRGADVAAPSAQRAATQGNPSALARLADYLDNAASQIERNTSKRF